MLKKLKKSAFALKVKLLLAPLVSLLMPPRRVLSGENLEGFMRPCTIADTFDSCEALQTQKQYKQLKDISVGETARVLCSEIVFTAQGEAYVNERALDFQFDLLGQTCDVKRTLTGFELDNISKDYLGDVRLYSDVRKAAYELNQDFVKLNKVQVWCEPFPSSSIRYLATDLNESVIDLDIDLRELPLGAVGFIPHYKVSVQNGEVYIRKTAGASKFCHKGHLKVQRLSEGFRLHLKREELRDLQHFYSEEKNVKESFKVKEVLLDDAKLDDQGVKVIEQTFINYSSRLPLYGAWDWERSLKLALESVPGFEQPQLFLPPPFKVEDPVRGQLNFL